VAARVRTQNLVLSARPAEHGELGDQRRDGEGGDGDTYVRA
jgi:hypothetical protein